MRILADNASLGGSQNPSNTPHTDCSLYFLSYLVVEDLWIGSAWYPVWLTLLDFFNSLCRNSRNFEANSGLKKVWEVNKFKSTNKQKFFKDKKNELSLLTF